MKRTEKLPLAEDWDQYIQQVYEENMMRSDEAMSVANRRTTWIIVFTIVIAFATIAQVVVAICGQG